MVETRPAKNKRGGIERRAAKMAANEQPTSRSKSNPELARKLRADSEDPNEVRQALDEAAGMSRNLWLAFLTFGTYLVIAVGSVTHRDLFLENPIKLPLLDVDLPLVAFFWVAPLLFLIFHAYLLLNLRLLVDNVLRYNTMVESARLKPQEEDSFRLLLTNFPFVQLLAGSSDTRRGLVGWLLTGIVWITVVFAPIVLLVMIQLQFLPYHHHWVVWVQRGAIIADLILLCLFWPRIILISNRGRARVLVSKASGAIVTTLIVFFVVLIATFPGERHDQNVVAITRLVPTAWNFPASEPKSIYELLFLGDVNEVTGIRNSLWSNTLVLPGADFVDDKKLDEVESTISLRGRDLRKAVLVRADLRKADFTGVNLNDADLSLALLDQTRFGCETIGQSSYNEPFDVGEAYFIESADFQWPKDGCSWLLRAKFAGASLKKAYMRSARVQGAVFWEAQLQEADLYGARLQGASFMTAHLEGASLEMAWAQGAFFYDAQLQGAKLVSAWLQSANLEKANLDGATLDSAWLHGASVNGASAYGTSFRKTQLQGAELRGIKLVGASLNGAFAWRARLDEEANVEPAKLLTSDFTNLNLAQRGARSWVLDDVFLDQDTFQAMRLNAIRGGMLDQDGVNEILGKLSALNPSQADPDYWPSSYLLLRKPADVRYGVNSHRSDLADALKQVVCRSESAPYALRGMLHNDRLKSTGPYIKIVLESLDKADICPATRVLTEADLLAVRNLQPTP